MFFVPETEGVSTFGKQMDFCRYTGTIERLRIEHTVANGVDGIIHGLHQECWPLQKNR